MAIDTAEKRRAVSGIGGVPLLPGVTPNSDQDAEWRAQSAWGYYLVSLLSDQGIISKAIGTRRISTIRKASNRISTVLLPGRRISK